MKGDEYSGLVFYERKNGIGFSKNEAELISENIIRILTTKPGERVGEPEFGSLVKTFLFMPQLDIDDLILEIINSINRQEPRVIVNYCTLTSAGQDDIVNIKLDLTLKTERKQRFDLGVAI
jgi:phage baseplate assembly protein W